MSLIEITLIKDARIPESIDSFRSFSEFIHRTGLKGQISLLMFYLLLALGMMWGFGKFILKN